MGYADENSETVLFDTPLGPLEGLKGIYEKTGEILYEFRGIPFAKPPTGSLRFRKPEPYGRWKGTLDATSFGAACLQNIPDFMAETYPVKTSEDCLFLNVFVPKILDRTKKSSVMVSIHGGGLEVGYGHQDDLSKMAMEGDVIMVSLNYRLGAFGFLALDHPALRGNYGLWDQKLALQWVHDNIAAFGGDPDSVTIFGESAGGYSVSLQSLIPQNKGLFQRVIAQSGVHSKFLMNTQKEIREYASLLFQGTTCPNDDVFKFADCLRGLSTEELSKLTDFYSVVPPEELEKQIFFKSYNYPVVDGDLFQENPILGLENSNSEVSKFFGSLDFIAGTTSNEGCLLYQILPPALQEYYHFNVSEGIPYEAMCEAVASPFVASYLENDSSMKEKLCNFYKVNGTLGEQGLKATHLLADMMFTYPSVKMLEYHAALGGRTYQYLFSKESFNPFGGPPPSWYEGSCHGDDLAWFFYIHQDEVTDEEKEFAKAITQYWTTFAKTG